MGLFNNITPEIKSAMEGLEKIDIADRSDGTPRMHRLRQIPPETGRFVSMLASLAPDGHFIEIGTSAGYSALWISLACVERGIKLKTYEILPEKISKARETFSAANITEFVELIEGDALAYLKDLDNVSFCFLDAEKELYQKCYDIIIPKLVKNGLLIADNAINHYETLKPMIDFSLSDDRVDSMVVPIGKGELFCRKR